MVYPDHVVMPFGLVPLLATVAAVTERLRVAAFVVNNDLRHPALLAQDMASLDVISGGRVEVAIGAGWNRPEYEALGIPFDPTGRGSRLAEAVAVIKGCFADGPFSFAGEHYTITGHDGLPKPVQRPQPPLFIGGGGRRVLTLAAREADIVGRGAADAGGRVGGEAVRAGRGRSPSPRPRRRSAGSARRPATASTTRDQRLPDRDVADPDRPPAEGRRRRPRRDPRAPASSLGGRVPRVAARVHRLGGGPRGEAPSCGSGSASARSCRRPRHARPGRGAPLGDVAAAVKFAAFATVYARAGHRFCLGLGRLWTFLPAANRCWTR